MYLLTFKASSFIRNQLYIFNAGGSRRSLMEKILLQRIAKNYCSLVREQEKPSYWIWQILMRFEWHEYALNFHLCGSEHFYTHFVCMRTVEKRGRARDSIFRALEPHKILCPYMHKENIGLLRDTRNKMK